MSYDHSKTPERHREGERERIETRTPNPSVFVLHPAAFAGVCVHLYLCLFVYVEELKCVTTSASLLMCTWCIWELWICVRLSRTMNNPEVKSWPFELRSDRTEYVLCVAAVCVASEAGG